MMLVECGTAMAYAVRFAVLGACVLSQRMVRMGTGNASGSDVEIPAKGMLGHLSEVGRPRP
eukprot:2279133-Rhodomonas_salina.1